MARRLAYDLSTDKLAIEALMNGLESFQRTMLSKPYDQAIHLIVALKQSGLKIVKAPRTRKIGLNGQDIDDLVKIHCKAEGPVSVKSIYHYVTSQAARRPMIEEIEESIDRLVHQGVISLYDNDEQMRTYY